MGESFQNVGLMQGTRISIFNIFNVSIVPYTSLIVYSIHLLN